MPMAIAHGQETLTRQAFGMHVTCTPGYSRNMVERANITEGFYDAIMADFPLLRHLCTDQEPASAIRLERLPEYFVKMSENDPELRSALQGLWEVYATHLDLQRAFPAGHEADVIQFAINDARGGSHYTKEILPDYAGVFLKLGARQK